MTDHSDVPIVATGDWIDAAWINQYIGDNVRALRQGFAAAGDMAYAVDSNTIAALSAGAAYKRLGMNSAGNAPEWIGFIGGKATRATDQSIATSPSTTNVQFTAAPISRLVTWSSGDNTKLTIGVSGVFILGITSTYDGGSGYREFNVLKNGGAAILETRFPTAAGETTYETHSALLTLASGDYLQLQTKHNQGSTINLRAASLWVAFQGVDA